MWSLTLRTVPKLRNQHKAPKSGAPDLNRVKAAVKPRMSCEGRLNARRSDHELLRASVKVKSLLSLPCEPIRAV